MKAQQQPMEKKISVRLTEKQQKKLLKDAKAHNMNCAEYIRAMIL